MRLVSGLWLAALAALALLAAPAGAVTIPFSEDYAAGDSGWLDNASSSLAWTSTGGAVDGGGYVGSQFNFVSSTAGAQGPVLFRGPASASGGSFAGNWLTTGVTELSFYVRTDATVPVNFFARFASPVGFPGAIAVAFVPVTTPGEWVKIALAINPSNPAFVSFEGSNFNAVFGNVGTVQVGVSIPTPLAGVDQVVHFDLDRVAIAPEPALAGLLGLALGVGALARRLTGRF